MLNIAIIGAGNISNIHAQAYRINKNTKIIAIVDSDYAKAENMAAIYDAEPYED